MPNLRARIARRNRRGGIEILLSGLAILTGLAFLGDRSPAPPSLVEITPYISYVWGGMWMVASVLTVVGVLSGNGKLESCGLAFFITCLIAYIPVVVYNRGAEGVYVAIIVAYAALHLWYRLKEIIDESRARNRLDHG